MAWWIGLAWAGKWTGEVADVEVTAAVPRSAEVLHAELLDWRTWEAIFPADCASEWQIPDPGKGLGSRATAKWAFGPLVRTVTGEIVRDQPGLVLEVEWLGKKGWFTRFTYAAADTGTLLTLRSPVATPKWPLTSVFFTQVRPKWVACYEGALAALAAR